MIERSERIDYYRKLMSLSFDVYHWVYDAHMQLQETSCKNVHMFEKILNSADVREKLIEQSRENNFPLILSISMGLVWCAVYEKEVGRLMRIHLIGPVFHRDISLYSIEESLKSYDISLTFKRTFVEIIKTLPVVNLTNLYQYIVMCHYAVNGIEIRRSDIRFQKHQSKLQGDHSSNQVITVDRRRTWLVEKKLLDSIRYGDTDYKKAFHEATALSSGLGFNVGDPLKHAKYSVMVFIALCTRAAVQVGLSPENAYSVGDEFSKSVDMASNVAEVGAINQSPYKVLLNI